MVAARSVNRATASERSSSARSAARFGSGVCSDGFRADPQRLPAGGQHAQVARRPQQPVGELGDGVDQVLAVVQQEQHTPAGKVLGQHVGGRPAGLLDQAERAGDGLGQQRLVAEPVELDQPHPAGEGPAVLPGDAQREPRLADPAHPGHRHQTGGRQQPLHLGHLVAAADEAGQLRR
jgi:hypothetical protein